MDEFKKTLELFIFGFVAGYFWHPVWTIGKRIWQEAKTAITEWKKHND